MTANLSRLIEDLKIIDKGPRSLMVLILKTIQKDGPDAKTFEGKRAAELMSKTELETEMRAISSLVAKQNEPSRTSDSLLTTKGIMSIIGGISNYP